MSAVNRFKTVIREVKILLPENNYEKKIIAQSSNLDLFLLHCYRYYYFKVNKVCFAYKKITSDFSQIY